MVSCEVSHRRKLESRRKLVLLYEEKMACCTKSRKSSPLPTSNVLKKIRVLGGGRVALKNGVYNNLRNVFGSWVELQTLSSLFSEVLHKLPSTARLSAEEILEIMREDADLKYIPGDQT